MISELVTAFLLACLLSGLLTALLCRWGPRLGLLDHPDGYRKAHARPTPLAGGLAIYLATVTVLTTAFLLPSLLGRALARGGNGLLTLLAGATVIVLVGLVDDRFGLRGRQKLAGQIAASLVVISGGLVIQNIDLFGLRIELGLLSIPFTLFWLVGAINSLNLLDGIDGLVSTIGFILASTVAVIAAHTGNFAIAAVAVVFAGSLVGFLWFNFPPAKIFLGDTGSMLIGLVIGSLAISGAFKTAGTVLLAAPVALLTIPIMDSGAAILRRKLTGRSMYEVDHGHLHHRLMARFGSHTKVLTLVAVTCLVTCLASLLSVFFKHDVIALLTCTAVVVVFIAADIFGRLEARLLASRIRHVGFSLVRPVATNGKNNGSTHRKTMSRLQGTADWEGLWDDVTQAAKTLELDEVKLDIHAPLLGESFSAAMSPHNGHQSERRWRLTTPIIAGDQVIGQITLSGRSESAENSQDIERSLTLIDQIQDRVPTLCGLDKGTVPAFRSAKTGLSPSRHQPQTPHHAPP